MLQGTIIIAVPPFLIVYLRPTHKIRILRTLYLFPLRGITAQATSFGSPCSSQNHSQLPFIPRSHLCATLWDDKTDATFFAHRIWCFILFCYNTTYKNACQEEIFKKSIQMTLKQIHRFFDVNALRFLNKKIPVGLAASEVVGVRSED